MGPAAKEYPKQYFAASALASALGYPLWRAAAIGQSGFTMHRIRVAGVSVPSAVTPYVYGFLPPYKGMVGKLSNRIRLNGVCSCCLLARTNIWSRLNLYETIFSHHAKQLTLLLLCQLLVTCFAATVFGMTWARASIFWLSDYGHDVLLKQGYSVSTATVLPPLAVSAMVQVMNQPIVRSTVTLQNPKYNLPNVLESCKQIYRSHGVTGLWHGTTAGILKTVPKYVTAIAVKVGEISLIAAVKVFLNSYNA